MPSEKAEGPWLIGGPSRCGKTFLGETLWKQSSNIAGLPVEALLTVYRRRWLLPVRRARENLLEEYLDQARYVDAERKKAVPPAKFLKSSAADLRSGLPSNRRSVVAIIGWALDRFAGENGRQTWAAVDLHPEFHYPTFRKQIEGLKLVVMQRDPYEALAAVLYWRGDRGEGPAHDTRFKYCLIMYCLSGQITNQLVQRWPRDVLVLNFNALVSGNVEERERLSKLFGIPIGAVNNSYDFIPDFQRVNNERFRRPNGKPRKLLNDTELSEIEHLTGAETGGEHWACPRRSFLFMARIFLAIGRVWPGLARTILDGIYYPRTFVQRRINPLKQLARDALRMVRHANDYIGKIQ